jgi:hypothetical protein
MIGVRRTLDANLPMLIVTMAINVLPIHAMLSWDVNILPSVATIMTHVPMIVVILILDVSTLLRTVMTAILALTTLVTTSKDACTPQPCVRMVTSVLYGPVTPPLAATLFHMYVTTMISVPPIRAIPFCNNATLLLSFAMTVLLVLLMLVLMVFACSPR